MKKIALSMIFAGAALMAADGQALFTKCQGCHGADGKTKALGKSNPIAGLPADEIVKDLEGYKAGTLNKHGMGAVMKTQAGALSEDDMKALADYISKLGK
ncbi:c-type cytochrome [Nitratifractor sp.]